MNDRMTDAQPVRRRKMLKRMQNTDEKNTCTLPGDPVKIKCM